MNRDERNRLAKAPIVWKGDFDDDCSAEWAGLLLQAERMDDNWWWWAVYDMESNENQIDSSNEYETNVTGGEAARAKAEAVAKAYLGLAS